jgi:hypothetical protein
MSDLRSSRNRIVDEMVMVDDDSSSENDYNVKVNDNDSENDDVETGRRKRRIESNDGIVTEETEYRDRSNQIVVLERKNLQDDDDDDGDDKNKCSGIIIPPLSGSIKIRTRTRSQQELQEHHRRRSSGGGSSSSRDNCNNTRTRVDQEEYNTNLAATSAGNKLQQQEQEQEHHVSIVSAASAIAPSLNAAVTATATAATTTLMGSIPPTNKQQQQQTNNQNKDNKKSLWIPPLRQPQRNQNYNVIFNVNNKVLVHLTLLNMANNDELTKDTYTTSAVNKFGYPNREGKRSSTEKSDHHNQEKFHGPFMFILCEIKQVHFDESERYYTVHRYDTGIDQRANPGWMEPISDPIAISAALNATKYGTQNKNNINPSPLIGDGREVGDDDDDDDDDDDGWLIKLQIYWTLTIRPFHQRLRIATKIILTELLHGKRPFSCKIRVTGINLLVLCSIIFLFLEVVNLAWLSPSYDDEVAIVGT